MTVSPEVRPGARMPDPDFVHPELLRPESTSTRVFRYVAAALRLSIGWVFLWAFLDKLLALGFATGRDGETGVVDRFGDAAWINGGSPTRGFLSSVPPVRSPGSTRASRGPAGPTGCSCSGCSGSVSP